MFDGPTNRIICCGVTLTMQLSLEQNCVLHCRCEDHFEIPSETAACPNTGESAEYHSDWRGDEEEKVQTQLFVHSFSLTVRFVFIPNTSMFSVNICPQTFLFKKNISPTTHASPNRKDLRCYMAIEFYKNHCSIIQTTTLRIPLMIHVRETLPADAEWTRTVESLLHIIQV